MANRSLLVLVTARSVRILLECFHVHYYFYFVFKGHIIYRCSVKNCEYITNYKRELNTHMGAEHKWVFKLQLWSFILLKHDQVYFWEPPRKIWWSIVYFDDVTINYDCCRIINHMCHICGKILASKMCLSSHLKNIHSDQSKALSQEYVWEKTVKFPVDLLWDFT